MRFKALILLALLLGAAACGEKVAPTAPAATGLAEITLVPYTSTDFDASGVVPDGWVEMKPGQFHRDMPAGDPTFLGQVTYPGASVEQVTYVAGFPESIGSMQTSRLMWDLYTIELDALDVGTTTVDAAVTETSAGVYVVMLATSAEEHDALHDAVFVAAVDALAPSVVTGEQAAAPPAAPPGAGPAPIDTRIRSDGMVMVYVPAGEFEMGNAGIQWVWGGSLKDGDLGLQVFVDEQPKHTVYLDAFWIDQTEVTVGMFRSFVEATGYETTAEREGWGSPWTEGPMEEEWPKVDGANWQHPRGPESSAEDDHPVVQVSWEDAEAYCAWAGGHLPTEAQWEKAARRTDGRMWPWGDKYDGMRGNFCDARCPIERWKQDSYDDGYAFTASVGSFPSGASPYGVLDMAGNVWEWVADWYSDEYYSDSASQNPLGAESGTVRAMRGGAWYDNEPWVRCTVRHQNPPWSRCDDVGFRCAAPAQ